MPHEAEELAQRVARRIHRSGRRGENVDNRPAVRPILTEAVHGHDNNSNFVDDSSSTLMGHGVIGTMNV